MTDKKLKANSGNLQLGDVVTVDQTNSRLGIGTPSPNRPLEISGGDAQFRINNPDTGGGYWELAQTDNAFGAGGGKLVFLPDGATSANSVLTLVNSSGNVGIGTASPTAKLDVSGSIKANNTVLATQAPSLPLTVGAVGSSTYYQFSLPAVNTWYNVFATNFNTTNGTVMLYGRIGLADRTVQQSFLAFTGKGAVNTAGDFLNIVQGSATYLRVNAGFLQMQSTYDSYGLSVYLYIVRIA